MKKQSLIIWIAVLLGAQMTYGQGQLKVVGGQTIIPLGSSYWIRDYNQTPQDNGVRLRMHARADNFNAAFIDYWKNLFFRSGNPGSNTTMHITENGYVGINGVADPNLRVWSGGFLYNNFRLQVFGNAVANRWITFSDSSIKENMIPIGSVMTQIMKLTPLEYNYKSIHLGGTSPQDSNQIDSTNIRPNTDSRKQYGFTAQQVKRIFPLLEEKYTENIGAVDYVGFVPLLVKGMQEQQRTIDTLRDKVDSLDLLVQKLRQEIVDWKGSTIDTTQDKTRLFQNNPNPFNGATTISYYIDENTTVSSASIEVRNIMGILQTNITLADQSGIGQVQYDGSALNQGYYIYTLKVNGSVKDSKMFLKEQ